MINNLVIHGLIAVAFEGIGWDLAKHICRRCLRMGLAGNAGAAWFFLFILSIWAIATLWLAVHRLEWGED